MHILSQETPQVNSHVVLLLLQYVSYSAFGVVLFHLIATFIVKGGLFDTVCHMLHRFSWQTESVHYILHKYDLFFI